MPPATSQAAQDPTRELPTPFAVTLSPLHKLLLGVSTGIVAALLVAALTVVHLLRAEDPYPLVLLAQYFKGYSVSPLGALVGAFWGFWVGFVGGWFFAFARNFIVGLYFVLARARADMQSDILDHI